MLLAISQMHEAPAHASRRVCGGGPDSTDTSPGPRRVAKRDMRVVKFVILVLLLGSSIGLSGGLVRCVAASSVPAGDSLPQFVAIETDVAHSDMPVTDNAGQHDPLIRASRDALCMMQCVR